MKAVFPVTPIVTRHVGSADAARLARTSRNHIRLACHNGQIKTFFIDGRRMVDVASMLKFMRERPDLELGGPTKRKRR
jgi:hypothetical protein